MFLTYLSRRFVWFDWLPVEIMIHHICKKKENDMELLKKKGPSKETPDHQGSQCANWLTVTKP